MGIPSATIAPDQLKTARAASATDAASVSPLLDSTAWRDAALIWIGQHLLLAAVTYVGRVLFVTRESGPTTTTWYQLLIHWGDWDGANYAKIAQVGYNTRSTAVLQPMLPLMEHVVLVLTGLDPVIAGILIANAASLGAFGLLRVLVERELGREPARRALLYLAVFPTAFFLTAAYSESLFLLFSAGCFLALRQRHWLVAGTLAALATLTRSVGILLLVPIAVECVQGVRRGRKRPPLPQSLAIAGSSLLPIVAYASFSLYLSTRFGTLFAASQAEQAIWGKDFALPFIGFARAGGALLRDGVSPNWFQAHILLDMVFMLLLIALALATWRRLPLSYALYALASLLLLAATPQHNWYALGSNMRYMLVVFPLFMVLGLWGERRNVERVILGASTTLLALLTVVFLLGGWVA